MATNPKAPSASFNPGHPDADPRGSLREGADDPQSRAAMRVAELRGNFSGGVLDEGTDDFYVDPSVIPAGWSYEWKMLTVLGKEDQLASAPQGQFSRDNKGSSLASVKRGYSPMPVPE